MRQLKKKSCSSTDYKLHQWRSLSPLSRQMHQIMALWINNIQSQWKKTAGCAELKPHKPNSTAGPVFHTNTNLGASVEADVKTKERRETGGLKEGQDCCWTPLHAVPAVSPGLWRASACRALAEGQPDQQGSSLEGGWASIRRLTPKCETKLCVLGTGRDTPAPKEPRVYCAEESIFPPA